MKLLLKYIKNRIKLFLCTSICHAAENWIITLTIKKIVWLHFIYLTEYKAQIFIASRTLCEKSHSLNVCASKSHAQNLWTQKNSIFHLNEIWTII